MSTFRFLRFQTSIPAYLTKSPQKALEKVVLGAVKHLNSLVPGAYDRSFEPRYEERQTKLGLLWDVLVVMKFRYKGPLPPDVEKLKTHHDITMQLRRNRGN